MSALLRLILACIILYVFAFPVFTLVGAGVTRHMNAGLLGMLACVGALLGAIVGTPRCHQLSIALLLLAAAAFSFGVLFPTSAELLSVEVPDRPVVLVTGGTKGIGAAFVREAAEHLAHLHPRIIVLARSPPSDGSVAPADFIRADFSSVASMKEVVAAVRKATDRLDLLVLNAGVADSGSFSELTKEGIPQMIAINHVSQVALYRGLAPLLEASPLNRLVLVSSLSNTEANATAILQPLDTPLAYRENAYALTKLLQIMYARALSRRTSTHVVTLHPGCIRSNINDATVLADPAASSRNLYRTELLAPLASVVVRLAQSIIDTMWEHGSVGGRRVLWAALDRRVASGDHVHNFGQLNVWVGPQATDVAACDTVYDNTVELVARFDQ